MDMHVCMRPFRIQISRPEFAIRSMDGRGREILVVLLVAVVVGDVKWVLDKRHSHIRRARPSLTRFDQDVTL
ncbi:hypothetical protein CCHR01_09324 [Colletotrichum chrysophilum]|uniref:Uncharacterized protein n=1 Tax=Colletotrichum chrysophilum TaxID=1836956 RepID=A0AAD9AK20_9PEZI|nr:hypothetical protein CCHR01_09324 [Colletotrichum chrysophilum]